MPADGLLDPSPATDGPAPANPRQQPPPVDVRSVDMAAADAHALGLHVPPEEEGKGSQGHAKGKGPETVRPKEGPIPVPTASGVPPVPPGATAQRPLPVTPAQSPQVRDTGMPGVGLQSPAGEMALGLGVARAVSESSGLQEQREEACDVDGGVRARGAPPGDRPMSGVPMGRRSHDSPAVRAKRQLNEALAAPPAHLGQAPWPLVPLWAWRGPQEKPLVVPRQGPGTPLAPPPGPPPPPPKPGVRLEGVQLEGAHSDGVPVKVQGGALQGEAAQGPEVKAGQGAQGSLEARGADPGGAKGGATSAQPGGSDQSVKLENGGSAGEERGAGGEGELGPDSKRRRTSEGGTGESQDGGTAPGPPPPAHQQQPRALPKDLPQGQGPGRLKADPMHRERQALLAQAKGQPAHLEPTQFAVPLPWSLDARVLAVIKVGDALFCFLPSKPCVWLFLFLFASFSESFPRIPFFLVLVRVHLPLAAQGACSFPRTALVLSDNPPGACDLALVLVYPNPATLLSLSLF